MMWLWLAAMLVSWALTPREIYMNFGGILWTWFWVIPHPAIYIFIKSSSCQETPFACSSHLLSLSLDESNKIFNSTHETSSMSLSGPLWCRQLLFNSKLVVGTTLLVPSPKCKNSKVVSSVLSNDNLSRMIYIPSKFIKELRGPEK